jgi:hypothetical protein
MAFFTIAERRYFCENFHFLAAIREMSYFFSLFRIYSQRIFAKMKHANVGYSSTASVLVSRRRVAISENCKIMEELCK